MIFRRFNPFLVTSDSNAEDVAKALQWASKIAGQTLIVRFDRILLIAVPGDPVKGKVIRGHL